MEKPSLSTFVLRHYLRSALVPVLTIELLLVAIYFGVTSWIERTSEATLQSELEATLPFLARDQAMLIDADFQSILKGTRYFADRHRDVELHGGAPGHLEEPPRFVRAPNGALYQANQVGSSSLFFPKSAHVGPRQLEIARATASLGPLYRHMVEDHPNVAAAYYNTADDMNRLHPFIEDVWKQYPESLHMADYNFYYLADSAHNPGGGPRWTGAYLDPAGNGWMVSCIAPVRVADTLAGVVGLDVTIKSIVDSLLGQKLPWNGAAFLADDSGTILAMPGPVETLFGLTELKDHVYDEAIAQEKRKPQDYNLMAQRNATLAGTFRDFYSDTTRIRMVEIGREGVYLVQAAIPATGWRVFLMVRASDVFASVADQSRTTRRIGWMVVAAMVVFYAGFFAWLRAKASQVARTLSAPIEDLAVATERMGGEFASTKVPEVGIRELDRLTGNFNALESTLAERSTQLVESRVEAGLRAREAELAYARGLFESASGYLHNVGNLTTRLSSAGMDLEEVARSGSQYPEMFRRIREEGAGPALDRLEGVLVGKVFPKIRATAELVENVRKAIHQTIEHQQATFLEARHPQAADEVDLGGLLKGLSEEFASDAMVRGIEIETRLADGVVVVSNRNQLAHGFRNGLRNAFDAIAPEAKGKIRVVVEPRGKDGRAVVTIADDGIGLDPEGRERLFTAGHTTKRDGHGLGLHSFAVFLSANNGRAKLESDGPGRGASLIVEVGDA
jgi:signal transduction histidine kinase